VHQRIAYWDAARRRLFANYLHHEIGIHFRHGSLIERWKFDDEEFGSVVRRIDADFSRRGILL
jgi:hypothetical protein